MKCFRNPLPLTIVLPLALALLLTPAAATAQDDGIDIEDAPTPTVLLELLPEGGIAAVDIDFWLIMENKDGPGGDAEQNYLHWSVQPVDGQLVLEMTQGSADDAGYASEGRIVFSAQGELVSYEKSSRYSGEPMTSAVGVVEGNNLVITTTNSWSFEVEPGGKPEAGNDTQTHTMPLEDACLYMNNEMLPLIFAYHIRQGSLGYQLPIGEMGQAESTSEVRVEDLGTEAIEVDGQEIQAHVIAATFVHRIDGLDEEFEHTLNLVVGEDGTFHSMHASDQAMEMNGYRATQEEVAELFGLDDVQEGQEDGQTQE